MAKVYFYYRSKSETGNLTIRLKHSNSIDERYSSKISSKRKYWFKTNGTPRNLKELSDLKDSNAKLHKLELENIQDELLVRFQIDFNKGVAISKEWIASNIDEVVASVNDKDEIRKIQEEAHRKEIERINKERNIYQKNLITAAIDSVIEIEYFDNPTQIKTYNQLRSKIEAFQEKKGTLTTSMVSQTFIDQFTAFLMRDLKHQLSTARKHCKSLVHAIKYQKNQYPEIIKVSPTLGDIKYKKVSQSQKRKTRDELVVTLTFEELDIIDHTDIPENLLNAKKTILFGAEIGLRVSDYDKLTPQNIKKFDGLSYWSFYNQKTGTDVIIPITDRIQHYIDKYGMPRTNYTKSGDVILNREIKEVCKNARINQMVAGRKSQSVIINGEKQRRTISKEYPKHELISTHSLRRTFATNYYKTLELDQIRQITGHASNAQLMEYINQGQDKDDVIRAMHKTMNKKHKERNSKKPQLKKVN